MDHETYVRRNSEILSLSLTWSKEDHQLFLVLLDWAKAKSLISVFGWHLANLKEAGQDPLTAVKYYFKQGRTHFIDVMEVEKEARSAQLIKWLVSEKTEEIKEPKKAPPRELSEMGKRFKKGVELQDEREYLQKEYGDRLADGSPLNELLTVLYDSEQDKLKEP